MQKQSKKLKQNIDIIDENNTATLISQTEKMY